MESIEKIIMIVGSLFLLFLFLKIFSLIDSISEYFKVKKYTDSSLNEKLKKETELIEKQKQPTIKEKKETTEAIIEMVTALVDDEVVYQLKAYALLNKKYELINLDDDIQLISEKVYKSLTSDLYITDQLIITTEYLMQIIIEECYISFLKNVFSFNKTLGDN